LHQAARHAKCARSARPPARASAAAPSRRAASNRYTCMLPPAPGSTGGSSRHRILAFDVRTAGMRVLDVGSGAGDVACLVAQLIGTTGEVIGCDGAGYNCCGVTGGEIAIARAGSFPRGRELADRAHQFAVAGPNTRRRPTVQGADFHVSLIT